MLILPCVLSRPKPGQAAPLTRIGIDISKNTFHLVGLDERGAIVLRQKLSRGQVAARRANVPVCLIGMEACVGVHNLSRRLLTLGHDVKLVPGQFVKPFPKGQKNDFRDAEAVAEAVQHPTMRFVPTKSIEQLHLKAPHQVRAAWSASAPPRVVGGTEDQPKNRSRYVSVRFARCPSSAISGSPILGKGDH